MKDLFKPEDFLDNSGYTPYSAGSMADIANAKLNELIEQAPVVYCRNSGYKEPDWTASERRVPGDTHKAKLMFIEELVKEPCKHEPINPRTYVAPTEGTFLVTLPMTAKCKHCGVELIADWKAK